MKTTKLILSVVSILVLLVFTLSHAEEKKAYVPKDDEEIYGTWVNTDYSGRPGESQKKIFYPNGTRECFSKATDTIRSVGGTFTLIDKWTDSEGNVWYKWHWEVNGYVGYELAKISSSGSIYEYAWASGGYPSQVNPNHPRYRIYYRK